MARERRWEIAGQRALHKLLGFAGHLQKAGAETLTRVTVEYEAVLPRKRELTY